MIAALSVHVSLSAGVACTRGRTLTCVRVALCDEKGDDAGEARS